MRLSLLHPAPEPAPAPVAFIQVAGLTGDEGALVTAIYEAENTAQGEIIAAFGELPIDGRRGIEIMLSAYLTSVAVIAVKLGMTAAQYAAIAAQAHAEAVAGIEIGSDIQGEA